MKLAITGPLPIPPAAFIPAVAPVVTNVAPAGALSTQVPPSAPRAPKLNETIRGGLTWAAISNLIGALPGRF